MSISEYMKKEWGTLLVVAIGTCVITAGVMANIHHSIFNVTPLEVSNEIALCEAELPRNVDCEPVVFVMPAPYGNELRRQLEQFDAQTEEVHASL